MNKELIKKYKVEFEHWLDGGTVQTLYKNDDEPRWLTDKECMDYDGDDNFSHIIENSLGLDDVLIVIDDEYVELRKAGADGKQLQVSYDNGKIWYDKSYKKISWSSSQLVRIKPEEPKFKVGDWVVYKGGGYCDGEILQITNIDKKNFCTFGSYDKLYHFDKLRLWKPKPGEWCWVFNKLREVPILRKVIKVEDNFKNRFNDEKFTKAVRVSRGDYLGDEVGYRFCEPFIGELPTTLKDYK